MTCVFFQSSEVAEIMPLSSFSQKFRPRPQLGLVTPPRPLLPKLEPGSVGADSPALSLTNDPILAQSPLKSSKISMDDTLGGFPVKCLVQIVRWLLNDIFLPFLPDVFIYIRKSIEFFITLEEDLHYSRMWWNNVKEWVLGVLSGRGGSISQQGTLL